MNGNVIAGINGYQKRRGRNWSWVCEALSA
jgi:hypothetical protein